MRKTFPLLIALAALALLGVAGCGSDDKKKDESKSTTTETTTTKGGGGGATTTLALAADPNGELKFDEKSLDAKTGKITLDFANKASVPHDVTIAPEGKFESSDIIKQTPIITGSSAKLTVDLKPGKYSFYCSVDAHRQAGMEGTLTVQ